MSNYKRRLLAELPETHIYHGWKRYEVVGTPVIVAEYSKNGKTTSEIITLVDGWQSFPSIDWALEAHKFTVDQRNGLTRNPNTGLLEPPSPRVQVRRPWRRSLPSNLGKTVRGGDQGDKSPEMDQSTKWILRLKGTRKGLVEAKIERRVFYPFWGGKARPRLFRRKGRLLLGWGRRPWEKP